MEPVRLPLICTRATISKVSLNVKLSTCGSTNFSNPTAKNRHGELLALVKLLIELLIVRREV